MAIASRARVSASIDTGLVNNGASGAPLPASSVL